MKLTYAFEKAEVIAGMIRKGVSSLRRRAIKDLPLLAWLPLLTLKTDLDEGKEPDYDNLEPRVHEILIFGSIAEGREEVGDIDMMVIDNGFFSRFFTSDSKKADWYEELSDNLEMFLTGWLDCQNEEVEKLESLSVDLHILPVKMLGSMDVRNEIASKHKDPDFLKNCFGKMLRYSEPDGKFVPVNLGYFEKRYNANLDDLRSLTPTTL